MYAVDEHDAVVELKNVPQSSVGTPCPMLLVGEHHLQLAYYLEERPKDWDGTTVRVVNEGSSDEPCALVRFKGVYAHIFGPPNDEAFSGHPLASRGLTAYRVFEVKKSSWLRRLERMNAVHPYHKAELFSKYKHFVFAFHDTTFECIAEAFDITVHRGSVPDVIKNAWSEV